jgi:hypothetical protein
MNKTIVFGALSLDHKYEINLLGIFKGASRKKTLGLKELKFRNFFNCPLVPNKWSIGKQSIFSEILHCGVLQRYYLVQTTFILKSPFYQTYIFMNI